MITTIKDVLAQSFLEMDHLLFQNRSLCNLASSGSAAVVVLQKKSDPHFANLEDSRGILFSDRETLIYSTTDLKDSNNEKYSNNDNNNSNTNNDGNNGKIYLVLATDV